MWGKVGGVCILTRVRMPGSIHVATLSGAASFPGLLLVTGVVSPLEDGRRAMAGSTAGATAEVGAVGWGIVGVMISVCYAKCFTGWR